MEATDREIVLKLARDTISAILQDREPDRSAAAHLDQPAGIFVSLHKGGILRGCIGYPNAVMPLCEAVVEAAKGAAFQDPRFPSVTMKELDTIDIEISVLTEPELIEVSHPDEYIDRIQTGRDGLILHGTETSGLLLPQVATKYNFDPEEFLECLCQKAGLKSDAWKDQANKIFRFEAEIFGERSTTDDKK